MQRNISGHGDDGLRQQTHAEVARLRECSGQDVDHTWLWMLNTRRGTILHADEFVDTVRFRLGCAGRTGLLDTGALRVSCCGLVRPRAGTSAEIEVPGTELRPADVLTSAIGNALTALDASICSSF